MSTTRTPERCELVVELALGRIEHAAFVAGFGMGPAATAGFGKPLRQGAVPRRGM